MSSPTTLDRLTPKSKGKFTTKRAKTCQGERRKNFYFTTGTPLKPEEEEQMKKLISRPYRLPFELKSMEDVKNFWEEEREEKMKEKRASYAGHHTYRSRLNLAWKRERLFVEDEVKLPGKSLTDDIDPEFFTMVTGRPIKEKTNMRQYLQDIRECFLTRLKTGYCLDEILLMDESHAAEKKKLREIQKNFDVYLQEFESFLKQDHVASSSLLKEAEEETKKSKDKLEIINGLKDELKKLEAKVLVIEEQWRNCRMFQKFLYIVSPSDWRKVHDPYYGKEDAGIASDPCLFDSFREFPGDTKIDLEEKILKFKEDVKEAQPPVLHFTDPQQLLNILQDLAKNNLIALAHSKELDFPAEKMATELKKLKLAYEEDEKSAKEEIESLKELVEEEEKKSKEDEENLKEIAFGLFRELITNEEYLSVTAFVEDLYEEAIAPNDCNLGLEAMIKEIEAKQESLLLALDIMPNDIMVKTTKSFFREQKRELKEAKEAEKKVHQMEMLLKRLSKALESPKKRTKERRIVRRSDPPELTVKFESPKILTKEEKDFLFFFGSTDSNAKLYRPLCP